MREAPYPESQNDDLRTPTRDQYPLYKSMLDIDPVTDELSPELPAPFRSEAKEYGAKVWDLPLKSCHYKVLGAHNMMRSVHRTPAKRKRAVAEEFKA